MIVQTTGMWKPARNIVLLLVLFGASVACADLDPEATAPPDSSALAEVAPGAGAVFLADSSLAGAKADSGLTASSAFNLDDSTRGDGTTLITGEWVDVRGILRLLAESYGLALQIAPDVEGLVNVHLENVDLAQALQAVLEPIGMGYELIDGTLIVYKNGMISRWFEFDYLVATRSGKGELRISGRSKGSGGIAAGSSDGENESHVSSKTEMAIWPELISALQTLVFDGQAMPQSADEAGAAFSFADEEGRSLVVSPMAGVLQVTAEWRRIRLVQNYLERMRESLHRQVAIEMRILEITLEDGMRSGIDWSGVHRASNFDGHVDFNGATGLAEPFFQFIVKGKSVSTLLEAVESQGNVKVVSTPRITTLNNQKSVVRIVTEEVFYEAQVEPPVVTNGVVTESVVAYTPAVIPVGIVLDVTPQIGRDGVITLNIHPTVTNIHEIVTSPNQDQAPVITVRELDTVGKVRDGETLVMAGLIMDSRRDSEESVPFLGRLPVIGRLFQRKVVANVKTELVMLLTPVVLNLDDTDGWARGDRASIETEAGVENWAAGDVIAKRPQGNPAATPVEGDTVPDPDGSQQ